MRGVRAERVLVKQVMRRRIGDALRRDRETKRGGRRRAIAQDERVHRGAGATRRAIQQRKRARRRSGLGKEFGDGHRRGGFVNVIWIGGANRPGEPWSENSVPREDGLAGRFALPGSKMAMKEFVSVSEGLSCAWLRD